MTASKNAHILLHTFDTLFILMNEVFFMLRKAFVSITLCAVLLLSPFVGLKVNALSADSISAPSAVLMESSTGKVLFEKNPQSKDRVRP